jgi:hypothetical protein
MSTFWQRALRVAQSNINDIKERATGLGRGQSLEEMSDAELEAELDRRRREAATRDAVDKAKGKAGTSQKKRPSASKSSPTKDGEALDLFDLSPKERRKVRQYYANLELPFGASLEDVKTSYRRLMRQYHPDKHQLDPARRELATQLSQKLTVAYSELRKLLKKKRS